jgi:DNA polymerase III gamma/tau subunit
MATIDTTLVGQEDSINLLNQVLKDPPHLFFSGGYGSGKTTLMLDFLKAYYKKHGISIMNSEWTLWLSSEQDRGIHCVRQSVAEFVRHSVARPGVYRWIIVDDADSLPIISQQALRRPMETHAHTTRFLFISRHSTDLIQPLKSRCLHLELETISPILLISHFMKQMGAPHITLHQNAIAMFMSIAQTPTEIKNICKILCKIYGEGGATEKNITAQDILSLFAAPSFSLCLNLIRAYLKKDKDAMKQLFLEIWTTGISYEDFLHELTSSVHQLGVLVPKGSQDIHQVILKGWVSFAQGKTHTLDLMRLFFSEVEDGRSIST